jgi:hypothetical protein
MSQPYNCVRCDALVKPHQGEHICADVQRRRDRQARQIGAVIDILGDYGEVENGFDRAVVAEAIVKRLNNLGVGQDA